MMGSTEIIIVVGVVLVLFGARAIPKFARSVGKAKHEFEKGAREGDAEVTDTDTDSTTNPDRTTDTAGTNDGETDKNTDRAAEKDPRDSSSGTSSQ